MLFEIDKIDYNLIKIDYNEKLSYLELFNNGKNEISDEVFSWIVNSPPIYMSTNKDQMKKVIDEHTQRYTENKEKSIQLTQLLKNEFYDFLCTKSKYYSEQRSLINGNINTLITGLATAIATRISGLTIGIATTFITAFILVIAKMSKKVACVYLKPE